MKKNTLTSAVVAGIAGAAGLAGVASAVNVNPDGLGQVLIYPYYTVNANQLTIFSVVNTTGNGKAVKVRLLEGRNSQEVLDFNLYLSPFDVWTAGLSAVNPADALSAGQLTTFDTSCTVPGIETQADKTEPFKNFQYAVLTPDGGPYSLDRTREGHIEVIEMGEVQNAGVAGRNYLTAITHVSGRPASCATLITSWQTPTGAFWGNLAANGNHNEITTPTGGLFGSAEIVNSDLGTNISYNAVAVDGFFIGTGLTAATDDLHFEPGNTRPALFDTRTSAGTSTAYIFQNGNLISADFGSNTPDAVSAVLMNNAIFGEYSTESSLNATSEWVITFPTKNLHLDRTFQVTPGGRLPFTAPDRAADDADDVKLAYDGNGAAAPAGACEPISVNQVDANGNPVIGTNGTPVSAIFNREEASAGQQTQDIQFSPFIPGQTPGLNLCFEAQVVSFNQATTGDTLAGNTASAVLGSRFARNLNLCRTFNVDGTCSSTGAFDAGWLRMNLGDNDNFILSNQEANLTRNQIFGLPVTGFWASNYRVSNDASILAYYSGTHQHRASRRTRAVTVTGDTGGAVTVDPTSTTQITGNGFSAS